MTALAMTQQTASFTNVAPEIREVIYRQLISLNQSITVNYYESEPLGGPTRCSCCQYNLPPHDRVSHEIFVLLRVNQVIRAEAIAFIHRQIRVEFREGLVNVPITPAIAGEGCFLPFIIRTLPKFQHVHVIPFNVLRATYVPQISENMIRGFGLGNHSVEITCLYGSGNMTDDQISEYRATVSIPTTVRVYTNVTLIVNGGAGATIARFQHNSNNNRVTVLAKARNWGPTMLKYVVLRRLGLRVESYELASDVVILPMA